MFLPAVAALAAGAPFVAIAAYAAWRQARAPSAARVAAVLEGLRAMSWEQFSALIEGAYRRQGYEVAALKGPGADFELRKEGRLGLVSCKRWKVAQTGITPLRDLLEAKRARDARECIYVAAGEFSANAREFAAKNGIRLLSGTELAQLLGPLADHFSTETPRQKAT
ncbi:MAG: restriction endonuclease [Betaproteobacteria bacterium]|nr:restriction endonuclease [Betaproteobacteria bacterium]MBI2959238.1 restriction endonuclease [Betaproteobacteria bacterium]